MAELGDLLTGGSQRTKDVTVEMLDYDFLDKCVDPDLIKAIVRKLRSGEEGHYPHLIEHAVKRLLEELPQSERSKILRMKAEPQPDEVYQETNDLNNWEEEMARMSVKIKSGTERDRPAPIWSSYPIAETEDHRPKVVEFHPNIPTDENGLGDTNRPTCSRRSSTDQSTTKRPKAYDYSAWEHYDVEDEMKKIEKAEEEEQRLKNEAFATRRTRAEQEEQRHARKREKQIDEATKGRFKESLSDFEKKRAADRERLKGNESFKAKEFEEAFRCYTCSLALDGENARVHSNRAAAAYKLERFEQGEDDCTRAIALDHGFKKAWMRRGMVRHSRGKYAAAVADFTEVLRLDPRERHALKLREHSVAKEREVEGEAAGKTHDNYQRKVGRILIEEIDSPQQTVKGDREDGKCATICPTKMVPPPVFIGNNKRRTIAHGWIEETRKEREGSLMKKLPVRIQEAFENNSVMERGRRVHVHELDGEDDN